jgi:hypothetical protein
MADSDVHYKEFSQRHPLIMIVGVVGAIAAWYGLVMLVCWLLAPTGA